MFIYLVSIRSIVMAFALGAIGIVAFGQWVMAPSPDTVVDRTQIMANDYKMPGAPRCPNRNTITFYKSGRYTEKPWCTSL